MIKKPDAEDGETQTPAIQIIKGTQSLRDKFALIKSSKNFFNLVEKGSGEVFWKIVVIKPLGGNRLCIRDEEYDINFNIQANITNAKLTSKSLENENKSTLFNLLQKIGFYSMTPNK